MADISRETIATLHDKITVKLNKDDYMPLFEKDIKNYSKSANIPGFRKGKVPSGVIKKMFGKGLFADAVVRTAEDNLKNYLVNEKLDIFGSPVFLNDEESMPKIDLQHPDHYEFLFEIGLHPEIDESVAKDLKAIDYKVEVKKEDIDERVDGFQSQFGELKDAEEADGPESILYVLIEEINDDGKKVDEGLSKDSSFYLKIFTDEFQKKFQGKKKDDSVEGTLNKILDPEKYPGAYQNINLDPKNDEETGKHVRVTITSVKSLDKAQLDEELFKKAFPGKEIKTEEEFRKVIEEEEQSYWKQASDNLMEHNFFHQISETPLELPEDFLKKLMNQQVEKPLSPEEIEKEYPTFSGQLKWSLITNKIINDQKLQITPDEIRADVREELKQYFGGSADFANDNEWLDGYIDRLMSDPKQREQRIDKLITKKVFDWLRSQVQIEEKEISQDDFKKLMNEHHHH